MSKQSARIMHAINVYWAHVERPDHDHRQGDDQCPCCSTVAERIRVGIKETRQIIADIRNGSL